MYRGTGTGSTLALHRTPRLNFATDCVNFTAGTLNGIMHTAKLQLKLS
jgi:hypothetical protein